MPVSGVIKLADANVWVAVCADGHTHHAQAREWFNAQPDSTCGMCRLTQMALLRHLTNAKIMGVNVQSQAQAWRSYDLLVNDPRVVWVEEPPGLEATFRRLTQSDSPSHARWTDAFLAAIALASQQQLVTFDQGFGRFAGLDLQVLQ
jgi:toxin-antitoxin system PIN domain toxin